MPHPDDLFVAECALRDGLINRQQLYETLWALEEERFERKNIRPLGVLLVARGHLKESDLRRILEFRSLMAFSATESQTEDLNFGRMLVAAGVATQQQIEECSAIQKASKVPGQPSRRMAEILVERGYVTAEQLKRVRAYDTGGLHTCPECGTPFNAAGMIPGNAYLCKKCSAHLAVPERAAPPAPRRSPPALLDSLSIGEQTQKDRALAIYLRQKSIFRGEEVREAEQIQLDFMRLGYPISLLEILRRRATLPSARFAELEKIDFGKAVHGAAWKAQVFPRYVITGKIASGGYATIFAAKRLFTEGPVALKVLHFDRAQEDISAARFRNEASLLMRFDHPNIVKGYESGSGPGGVPFLAMEYVQGESIDHVLSRRGALPPDLALDVVGQVARGLLYMQKEGWIHRDVKPENIILDDRRHARLCDLGFAKQIGDVKGPGTTETTVGTVGYMSPEQTRGEIDLKAGTDIYSLGLTLFAMLTGKEPFESGDSGDALAKRFESGGGAPEILSIPAPQAVLAILIKMVQPDRTKRFATYPELLQALGRRSE